MFRRKQTVRETYDAAKMEPALRCSICTGERVAGFVERATGRFHDVALITSDRALQEFRERYGIEGELRKIY